MCKIKGACNLNCNFTGRKYFSMSDFKSISELVSKINNLLEAVRKNGNQFSVLDKDMATSYVRQLYELTLAIQPVESINRSFEKPVVKENPAEVPDSKKMEVPVPESHAPVLEAVKTDKEEISKPAAPLIKNESPKKKDEENIAEQKPEKATVKNETKTTISEMYAKKEGKSTLNEKYKSEGKIIADKLKLTPIKDLRTYIGLNKRITFINLLFRGKEQQYEEAISKLDSFKNYDEASQYIRENLLNVLDWKDDEPAVAEFFNLVMRRYLS